MLLHHRRTFRELRKKASAQSCPVPLPVAMAEDRVGLICIPAGTSGLRPSITNRRWHTKLASLTVIEQMFNCVIAGIWWHDHMPYPLIRLTSAEAARARLVWQLLGLGLRFSRNTVAAIPQEEESGCQLREMWMKSVAVCFCNKTWHESCCRLDHLSPPAALQVCIIWQKQVQDIKHRDIISTLDTSPTNGCQSNQRYSYDWHDMSVA